MVCRFESGSSPSTVRTGSRRPAANNFLRLKDRQLGLGGTERRHEMSLPVLFFPSPSFHFTFLSFTLSSFHFTLPSSIYVSLSFSTGPFFLLRLVSFSSSLFSSRRSPPVWWRILVEVSAGEKKGREKSLPSSSYSGKNEKRTPRFTIPIIEESARKIRLFAWCVNVSSNERILLSFEEREGGRRRKRIRWKIC